MNLSFAAIDFETATGYMESACAVGIVTVTDGEITDEYYSLIQPPENEYWRANMLVHGITPGMTESLPGFHAIYPEVKKRLQGNVVVAHNEQFDRNVLKNTMRMYGLDYDELSLPERWECTCRIYRSLGYKPVNLSACCEREGIELKHHEALSDARGCAKLYLNFLENTVRSVPYGETLLMMLRLLKLINHGSRIIFHRYMTVTYHIHNHLIFPQAISACTYSRSHICRRREENPVNLFFFLQKIKIKITQGSHTRQYLFGNFSRIDQSDAGSNKQ